MPTFFYKARTSEGALEEGVLEAKDHNDLVKKLSQKGMFPITIQEKNRSKIFSGKQDKKEALPKVKRRHLIEFTNQVSTLLNAGVGLVSAIGMACQQTESEALRVICKDIRDRVSKGQALSFALSQYPSVFSKFYVALVSAGEKGAFLDKALLRLSELLEYEDEVQSSIVGELVYPALVILIGLASIIFILIFVVPKMKDVLLDMGQALPVVTRILLWVSDILISYWWVWIGVLLGGGVLFWLDLSKSKSARQDNLDRTLIKIPFLGKMIVKVETGRFIKVLGVLLSSGISVVKSLQISANLISNSIIKGHVLKVAEKLKKGVPLAKAFEEEKIFPAMLSGAVATGQESGTLDIVLLKLGDYYEKDVRRQVRIIVSMLGPISILSVGVFIGLIVISVLMPIFQMNIGG